MLTRGRRRSVDSISTSGVASIGFAAGVSFEVRREGRLEEVVGFIVGLPDPLEEDDFFFGRVDADALPPEAAADPRPERAALAIEPDAPLAAEVAAPPFAETFREAAAFEERGGAFFLEFPAAAAVGADRFREVETAAGEFFRPEGGMKRAPQGNGEQTTNASLGATVDSGESRA